VRVLVGVPCVLCGAGVVFDVALCVVVVLELVGIVVGVRVLAMSL